MKCLSYQDPWGYLVALGIKPVDNRSWGTSFRGRIYIQVSKTFDNDGFQYIITHPELWGTFVENSDILTGLAYVKNHQPNAGKIIGEVDVVDCVDKYDSPWFFGPHGLVVKNSELYPHPVPCKGKIAPHFFDVPPEVEAEIRQMKFENVPTEIDYDNDCAPD
jgi:hypothetical protein